jgi:polyisoprenoid-binding protein YceI
MRRGAALAAFLVAGAVPVLAAQSVTPAPLREGMISFAMRATTVNDFTGTVAVSRAEFHGTDLANVTGTVEVPVAQMRTGIGLRDRPLRGAMRADSFPAIRFELVGLELGAPRGDTIAVTYQGQLTIHGVTRTVHAPGWVLVRQPGAEVHAELPLDMREYGITPPTRFLGAVKVDPMVGLAVHLVFGP